MARKNLQKKCEDIEFQLRGMEEVMVKVKLQLVEIRNSLNEGPEDDVQLGKRALVSV